MTETTFFQDLDLLEALLLQVGWVSRRRMEQELDNYGLTPPQYVALRCIQDSEDGCSMTQLAESSIQVSATMTGIIDRLVERGLVQRERVPSDRRALRVFLTGPGSELLDQVRENRRARLQSLLETLTPEERKMMIRFAERYLSVLNKENVHA